VDSLVFLQTHTVLRFRLRAAHCLVKLKALKGASPDTLVSAVLELSLMDFN